MDNIPLFLQNCLMTEVRSGDILSKAMEVAGISPNAFATLAHIEPDTLYRYCNDQKPIPEKVFRLLMEVLDLAEVDPISLLPLPKDQPCFFHTSSTLFSCPVDVTRNIGKRNDFGHGFYLGENLRQASSWGGKGGKTYIYVYPASLLSDAKVLDLSKAPSWRWLSYIGFNRNKFSPSDFPRLSRALSHLSDGYDVVKGKIADSFNFSILELMFLDQIDVDQAEMASVIIALGDQLCVKSPTLAQKLVPTEVFCFDETVCNYFRCYRQQGERKLHELTKEILSRSPCPERTFSALLEKDDGFM